MFTKKITFTNYRGEVKTKEYNFFLSEADILELQLSDHGSLQNRMQAMADAKDNESLYGLTKDIICRAYGEISIDGDQFIKNEEVTTKFLQSPAYVELLKHLGSSEKAITDFIQATLPEEHRKAIEELNKAEKVQNDSRQSFVAVSQ